MRLLSFERKDGCLVIHTDEGDRKVMLSWRGIQNIEAKCNAYIGKQIRHTTYGSFDPKIWFSDIFLIDEDSQLNTDNQQPHAPTNLSFKENNCLKIYGPPGTGKTKYLIDVVQYAIRDGVNPEHIAFLSFTNAAADEAQLRVSQVFPELGSISFPHFSTIHSLATRIGGALNKTLCQREHINQFDINIVCEDEWLKKGDASSVVVRFKHPIMELYCLSLARLEEFEPHLNPEDDFHSQKLIDSLESYFKIDRSILIDNFNLYMKRYVNEYINFKINNQLADFNDVIINVLGDSFESRLPTFEVLIIDEAQDLSDLQWSLIKKLIPRAKEVYVAGDDDQAIMISFGASSHAFLELKGQEKDLPQSYRVPKEISDYVNKGVMQFIKQLPNRKDKEWLPAAHTGSLKSQIETENLQTSKETSELEKVKSLSDYSIDNLLSEIVKNREEEWLIMSPTRKSGESISTGLQTLNIPHFYRNKPRCHATRQTTRIEIRSIHTSKGMGAENVAIVSTSIRDVMMLANDPRLSYVALTRAKKCLYPRVTKDSLLPYMIDVKNPIFNSAVGIFLKMFPR